MTGPCRVLACQGGGLKGSKQVECVRGLVARNRYDLCTGTSTGSLTAYCAASEQLGILRGIYNHIDDPTPANGVRGVLKLSLAHGYYSTEPLAEKLAKHVALDRLVTDYSCGVVTRRPLRHRMVASWEDGITEERLRRGIQASCSVGGAMDYQWMRWPDGRLKTSDGGHLHTIPPVPRRHRGRRVTHVDVIMCNPASLEADLGREDGTEDSLFESWVWVMEAALAQTQIHDLEALRAMARDGIEVMLYAPPRPLGGLVQASQEVISAQLEMGEWMLDHPVNVLDLGPS